MTNWAKNVERGINGENKRKNVKISTWNIKTLNEKELELGEEYMIKIIQDFYKNVVNKI